MDTKSTISGDILNMFADIVCTEIASRLLDGVHWVVLNNSIRNKNTIERILQLRRELDAKGYPSNSIVEVIKLSNGYLFNLDIDECYIVFEMLLNYSNTNEFDSLLGLIPNKPNKVLEQNKLNLAKLCYHRFIKKQKDELDVCLYSTNDYSKIIVSAVTSSNDRIVITYNAFKVTLKDLDDINKKYLAERGMRISSSVIMEIVDGCVRVRLTFDTFDNKSYKEVN